MMDSLRAVKVRPMPSHIDMVILSGIAYFGLSDLGLAILVRQFQGSDIPRECYFAFLAAQGVLVAIWGVLAPWSLLGHGMLCVGSGVVFVESIGLLSLPHSPRVRLVPRAVADRNSEFRLDIAAARPGRPSTAVDCEGFVGVAAGGPHDRDTDLQAGCTGLVDLHGDLRRRTWLGQGRIIVTRGESRVRQLFVTCRATCHGGLIIALPAAVIVFRTSRTARAIAVLRLHRAGGLAASRNHRIRSAIQV